MKNIKILIIISLAFLISFKKISNMTISNINTNNNCQYNLKIDSINFNKCLYDTSSKYNSLNYGLEVYHDKPIVILGHSGTKENAVFNDLNKLALKDEITLNYPNHINEKYKVYKKYYKQKSAELVLEGDLILATCDRKDLTKQIIIVASIIDQN